MPKPLTQSQAQAISTQANIKYLWSTFLSESFDPVLGAWVDPLTVDMQSLLNMTDTRTPIQWTSNMKITTLSYQVYGTTSLWAIILYLNGYSHPDEIPAGATLLLPSQSAIDSLKSDTQLIESNKGKSFKV